VAELGRLLIDLRRRDEEIEITFFLSLYIHALDTYLALSVGTLMGVKHPQITDIGLFQ
jgi:hypothetical protein